MPFTMIDYQTKDPQYKQYNGRIAIVLPWSPAYDEPYNERYTIITPLKVEDYPGYVNCTDTGCVNNSIQFHPYSQGIVFETSKMIKFTERAPIKPPTPRWNKYNERDTFVYRNGRWQRDGYEKRPEQEEMF